MVPEIASRTPWVNALRDFGALWVNGAHESERFLFYDEIFTWISLATVGFVLFATLWVWRAAPREPERLTPK